MKPFQMSKDERAEWLEGATWVDVVDAPKKKNLTMKRRVELVVTMHSVQYVFQFGDGWTGEMEFLDERVENATLELCVLGDDE